MLSHVFFFFHSGCLFEGVDFFQKGFFFFFKKGLIFSIEFRFFFRGLSFSFFNGVCIRFQSFFPRVRSNFMSNVFVFFFQNMLRFFQRDFSPKAVVFFFDGFFFPNFLKKINVAYFSKFFQGFLLRWFFPREFFRGLFQRFFLKRFRSIFQSFFFRMFFFSRILLPKFLFFRGVFFFFQTFVLKTCFFFSIIFYKKEVLKKGFSQKVYIFEKMIIETHWVFWSVVGQKYVFFSKMFCANFCHKKGFSIMRGHATGLDECAARCQVRALFS